MPLSSLTILPLQPIVVLGLDVVEVFLQLIDRPLVEASHLLDLQVEVFDLLVLVVDGVLKVPLLVH